MSADLLPHGSAGPQKPPPATRRVVLLGAAGSVGRQALSVIEANPERFSLVGATVEKNHGFLLQLHGRYPGASYASLLPDPASGTTPPWLGVGLSATLEVSTVDCDVVLVAIPGAAALEPAMVAVRRGRDIALSSKEVMVMAGPVVNATASQAGSRIFPVDSEHSAIWQCLRGEAEGTVLRLLLTASGGALRDLPLCELQRVTPEQALAHPTWSMGPKVTVDSASLMNKGLEIIEARHLFSVAVEHIDVLLHRQSIVHSMVEFVDGAIMAQIGSPDMRLPVALALSAGDRLEGAARKLDLSELAQLEFAPVDQERYPLYSVARSAATDSTGACIAMNAADEVAVAAFLSHRCGYLDIVSVVSEVVAKFSGTAAEDIPEILELDRRARQVAHELLAAVGGP